MNSAPVIALVVMLSSTAVTLVGLWMLEPQRPARTPPDLLALFRCLTGEDRAWFIERGWKLPHELDGTQ